MTIDRNRANRELLAFYSEAGVDIALREEPNDWLSAEEPAPSVAPEPAQPAAAPAQRPAPVSAPVQRAVPVPPPPDAAVLAARSVGYSTRPSGVASSGAGAFCFNTARCSPR